MDKKELKMKYDELVAGIETTQMFDGRGCGVDVYVCKKCGSKFYTRYMDKGVTPFTIRCRDCEKGTAVHEKTISEGRAKIMDAEIHNWVRPTFDQLLKLNEGAQEHVLNGGLMLEDELENKPGIENAEIKKTQRMAQKLLETLQGTDASFFFVGNEGNCFTMGGDPDNIVAHILFAMCRYPIVRDIIKTCAELFDAVNKECGDKVRSVTMNHLIEQNSGN